MEDAAQAEFDAVAAREDVETIDIRASQNEDVEMTERVPLVVPKPLSCSSLEALSTEAAILTHALATGGYPVDELEALESCIEYLLDPRSLDGNGCDEVRTTFIIDTLPSCVRTLLERAFASDMAERVNTFFQLVIPWLVTQLPMKHRSHFELMNALLCPSKTGFYASCGWEAAGEWVKARKTEAGASIVKSGWKDYSRFLVENVSCFASSGGLSRVTNILHESDVPLWTVKLILQPFCRIGALLDDAILEQLVITWMKVVCDRLLTMDSETMKSANREDIQFIKIYLRLLGRLAKTGLRQLEFCTLELSMKFLKGSTLEKRLMGLNDIVMIAENLVTLQPTVPAELESGTEPKLISDSFLQNWIRQEQLLPLLFGDNSHPQIMSRAGPILLFLAKTGNLTVEDLDLVWSAGENKHESLVHIVYGLFAEICSALEMGHIEYLFAAKIRPIKPSVFDAPTFTLLRSLSLAAIPIKTENGGETEDVAVSSRFFGIHFAWEMLQDGTYEQLSKDSKGHALAVVQDFLGWQLCFSLREVFLSRCLQNLKRFTTISMSLKVAMAALKTFEQEGTEAALLCKLDEQEMLLSVIFHALTEYKRQAAVQAVEGQSTMGQDELIDRRALCGPVPHQETMQDFLTLLEFVLNHSSLLLNTQQIDSLWQSLVVNTISLPDRDRAFLWLETLRKSSKPGCTPFLDEDSVYILNEKIPTLNFKLLSAAGYQFVQTFFYHTNLSTSSLPQQVYHSRLRKAAESTDSSDTSLHTDRHDQEPLCGKLVGVDLIWRAALTMENDAASKRAMEFLASLYRSPLEVDGCHSEKEHEIFIQTAFSWIASSFRSLAGEASDIEESEVIISRALSLLRTLLQEHASMEADGATGHGTITKGQAISIKVNGALKGARVSIHTNDTVSTLNEKLAEQLDVAPTRVRIFSAGKELRSLNQTVSQAGIKNDFCIIVAVRAEAAVDGQSSGEQADRSSAEPARVKMTPRAVLSKPEYFEQLFGLLDSTPTIAQSTWDLLMLLPTNKDMLSDISSRTDTQAAGRWSSALDPKSVFKLLYSLQIIQSVIDRELQDGSTHWCSWFIANGGVAHLIRILTANHLMSKDNTSKQRQCIIQLLKVIAQFSLRVDAVAADEDLPVTRMELLESYTPHFRVSILNNLGQSTADLVNQLMALCWGIAPTEGVEESEEARDEVSEIVRLILLLLVTLSIDKEEALLHLWSHHHLKDWIARLLCLCPNQRVRAIAGDAILQLCGPRLSEDLSCQCFSVLFGKLLELLPSLGHNCPTAEEFYSVLCLLLEQALTSPELPLPCTDEQLYCELVKWLGSHKPIERTDYHSDPVLKGTINALRVLVLSREGLKKHALSLVGEDCQVSLIQLLFCNCLFAIPARDSQADSGHLPLCKSPPTRLAAFELLEELVAQDDNNMRAVLELLANQHPTIEHRIEWQYTPSGMTKSSSGFVGLVNQGATCYMNSLLQQLFMTADFRRDVLKISQASRSAEELKESVLHQIQTIFCGLQESNQRAYDTIGLCKAFKDFEGNPVNPGLQMDADEFCNMLFDKLETAMKDLGEENVIKKHFGGELSNQVISKDCGHVSETVEPFYSLSVAVKGKSSLETSLELYVEGDMLEGDNKYHCSTCDAKVVALKRCCVRSLPDTLIIHMRRFEFNFEHMRRMKVNDFCSFPFSLDMEPYTKQGLDEHAQAGGLTSSGNPLRPKEYFKFELVGVVVHTGTAESGHYYSFIKDRLGPSREWYQFNDRSVDIWNKGNLSTDCFGGYDTVMQWDSSYQKQVAQPRERANNAYMLVYERVGAKAAEEMAEYRNEKLCEFIWKENEMFWRDKHLFDEQYYSFMVSLCRPSSLKGFTHDLATIKLATNYFLSVLCYAKEEETIGMFVGHLKDMYRENQQACEWFLELFISEDLITVYLLKCYAARTRQMVAGLILHVLGALTSKTRAFISTYLPSCPRNSEGSIERLDIPHDAPASIKYVLTTANLLLDGIEDHWRRFTQFFVPLRGFCKFGHLERQFLISISVPARLIHFYLGERSPLLAEDGQQGEVGIVRRPAVVMGDNFTPPRVGPLIDTISELTRCCYTRTLRPPGLSPYFSEPLTSSAVKAEDSSEIDPATVPQLPQPLSMLPLDERLLYSDRFFLRLLTEGVNVPASIPLVQHLVWDNDRFSRELLDVLVRGMASSKEESQDSLLLAFAAVLEVEDEFRAWRHSHGLQAFVRAVSTCVDQGASFALVKFIADLSTESAPVRDWLFANMSAWVGSWLIVHKNDEVRYQAQELLQSFMEDSGTQVIAASEDGSGDAVTIGVKQVCQTNTMAIFIHLLELLATIARKHIAEAPFSFERKELQTGQYVGTGYYANVEKKCSPWKLVSYFQLLRECVVSDRFRDEFFEQYWSDFFRLYVELDSLKASNDHNKRELILFLDWCLESQSATNRLPCDSEEPPGAFLSVQPSIYCCHLTRSPALYNKFLNYHLTILLQDDYLRFNRSATSVFYRVLLRCSLASLDFLLTVLEHVNFLWSVENFYLSLDYPEVATVLFELIRLGVHNSAAFKAKLLPKVLMRKRERLSHRRLVQCVELLLTNDEDARVFCKCGGPSVVSLSPDLLAFDKRGYTISEVGGRATVDELTDEELSHIARTLGVLVSGVEWLGLNKQEFVHRAAEASELWHDKHALLPTLCVYLERVRSVVVLDLTYRLLKVLCLIDTQYLESVMLLLHQEHINYAHACGGISLVHIGEVTGPPVFKVHLEELSSNRRAHEDYYEFLRRMCHVALLKFFSAEDTARITINLALLGILECVHVSSACRLMCDTLVQLWHSQVPLKRVLKEHSLLTPLVLRAFTRDQRLLDLDECMRLVSLAFGHVANKLEEDERSTLIISIASRIEAVVQLAATPEAPMSEAAGLEVLRVFKALTTVARSQYFVTTLLKPNMDQIKALVRRAGHVFEGEHVWPQDEIAAHIVSLSS